MLRTCLAFLVLFLGVYVSLARELPDSPCPEIFRYRFNGTSRQWYGWGHIKNVTEGEYFTLFIRFNVNVPKDFEFAERQRLEATRTGNDIEFIVHFPIQTPLPELELIIFKMDFLCLATSGPGKPGNSGGKKILRYRYLDHGKDTITERSAQMISTTPIDITEAPSGSETSTENSNESVKCGTLHPLAGSTGLVAGGETITRGTWPWLVAVFAYNGPTLSFRCGASLISERLVLSAAHCFFNKNGYRLRVRNTVIILGKYSLRRLDEEDVQIIYPDYVIIHPDYKAHKPDADIAVLVTPESLQFSKFIRPICLWNASESEDITNRQGIAAGWGMDEEGNLSDLPMRVSVPVVSNFICRNAGQWYQLSITERTMCVGWRNGTTGVCRGDSGGGFTFKMNGQWVLRGLVSTSPPANQGSMCNLNEYIIFTDVSKFLDWIQSKEPSNQVNYTLHARIARSRD